MSFSILPVGDLQFSSAPAPATQAVRAVSAAADSSAAAEETNEATAAAAGAGVGTSGGREFSPFDKPKEEANADLRRLEKSFDAQGITLEFSRDEETDRMVVKMIDQKTGEAVRQLPSEVSLKLTAEIGKLQGLIVDRKV